VPGAQAEAATSTLMAQTADHHDPLFMSRDSTAHALFTQPGVAGPSGTIGGIPWYDRGCP
jgi:hypothetical protein